MAPNGKCIFNLNWLEKDLYKDWLLAVGNNKHEAKCKVCNKNISVASMGEAALTSHMSFKRHKKLLEAMLSAKKVFASPSSAAASSQQSDGKEKDNKDSESKKKLQNYLQTSETLDAEILWVLRTVKWHHSFRSNTDMDKVFKIMFPDSAVAANFSCSERKTSYVAIFGLAPHFKNLLLKDLEGKDFVLLFDETLNSKTLTKQMDIYVRFWLNDHVKTYFVTSVFLGHATSSDMFEILLSSILPLTFKNVLQLSMDGPNVNLKLHRLINEHMLNDYAKQLINIGTCSLHIVHNAFKQGFESLDWGIGVFLYNIYKLFKHSPARREDFSTISGARFPLKFVSHRWLENVLVCERALEILPQLQTYIELIEKGKFDEPPTTSFQSIRCCVKDNLFPVRLNIFLSVANIMEPFLKTYQTDKPMLPYMSGDIKKIILALMRRFLKSKLLIDDATKKEVNIVDLIKIKSNDPKNHLSTEKIDLGFVAEKQIKELHSSKKVSDGEILNLRRDVKSALIKIVTIITSKSPVNFSIIRNVSCLIPQNLVEDKQGCLRKMKCLLHSLSDLNIINIKDCDSIQGDFIKFVNETVCENTPEFLNFNIEEMRLDEFFYFHLKNKHEKSWQCIQKLLVLSHGQATVERGFSTNKKIEVENLKENSYIAMRIISDHINRLGGDVTKVIIDKDLRKSVMSARHRYDQYLEDQRKMDKNKQKRKIDDDNEIEFQKKKETSTTLHR